MPRLIDADVLVAEIKYASAVEGMMRQDLDPESVEAATKELDAFVELIDAQPTVQQERTATITPGDGMGWCSECEVEVHTDRNGVMPNYCPECGAKFKEAK